MTTVADPGLLAVDPAKATPFCRLPAAVLRCTEIRPSGKVVYAYLCRRWCAAKRSKGSWISVSLSTFLEETGLSKYMLYTGLDDLEKLGLIERKRTGRATRYRLLPISDPIFEKPEIRFLSGQPSDDSPFDDQMYGNSAIHVQEPVVEPLGEPGATASSKPRGTEPEVVPDDPSGRRRAPRFLEEDNAVVPPGPPLTNTEVDKWGKQILDGDPQGDELVADLESLGYAWTDAKHPARQRRNQGDLYTCIEALYHEVSDPVAFLRWECKRISARRVEAEEKARWVAELIHHGVKERMHDLFYRFECYQRGDDDEELYQEDL